MVVVPLLKYVGSTTTVSPGSQTPLPASSTLRLEARGTQGVASQIRTESTHQRLTAGNGFKTLERRQRIATLVPAAAAGRLARTDWYVKLDSTHAPPLA